MIVIAHAKESILPLSIDILLSWLGQHMLFLYVSHYRAANAKASLHKCVQTRKSFRCSHTQSTEVNQDPGETLDL